MQVLEHGDDAYGLLACCKQAPVVLRPRVAMGNAEHGPFEPAVRESAAGGTCAAVAVPAERSVSAMCAGSHWLLEGIFWSC